MRFAVIYRIAPFFEGSNLGILFHVKAPIVGIPRNEPIVYFALINERLAFGGDFQFVHWESPLGGECPGNGSGVAPRC